MATTSTESPASTRQRLLDAAAGLFLGQGAHATSLEQVRQRAGVSNGSLYHHFASKAHLAQALYLQAMESYHAAMAAALQGTPPAAEGVRALVARHIDWVLRHPQQARVLLHLRGATHVEGEAPDWAAVNARAFEVLQTWIDAEVRAGRMHRMPFHLWLALVLAPTMARSEAWLRHERPKVEAAERRWLADAAARAVALGG
ncbi:MAG: TetR/AcrR family transcriptional regulator [Rubrivivax sp.]